MKNPRAIILIVASVTKIVKKIRFMTIMVFENTVSGSSNGVSIASKIQLRRIMLTIKYSKKREYFL